jgi:hypothetical protein
VSYVLRLKVSLVRSNVIKSLMFRASLINLAMVEWLINLCQVGEVTNKSRLGGGVTSSLPCSEQHYKVSLVRSGLDLFYMWCLYCDLLLTSCAWLPDINYFSSGLWTHRLQVSYGGTCNWVDLRCLCCVITFLYTLFVKQTLWTHQPRVDTLACIFRF